MPRLILVADDGRELFNGKISDANVQLLAQAIAPALPALRQAAAFKRALEAAGVFLEQMSKPAAARHIARPRARRRP